MEKHVFVSAVVGLDKAEAFVCDTLNFAFAHILSIFSPLQVATICVPVSYGALFVSHLSSRVQYYLDWIYDPVYLASLTGSKNTVGAIVAKAPYRG